MKRIALRRGVDLLMTAALRIRGWSGLARQVHMACSFAEKEKGAAVISGPNLTLFDTASFKKKG